MREKKEQRKPSALQKKAAEADSKGILYICLNLRIMIVSEKQGNEEDSIFEQGFFNDVCVQENQGERSSLFCTNSRRDTQMQ